eukprot:TRINITY_DN5395_c2_g1_i1.p1 TRINITY_DN5395_c2_g1~~TRINITY_DN5395_c2_g1_i1.p1  ORF type:complete len:594 (-),score=43.00 TRINITY_DN5395_c2_g1_i1:306-2018(-)
MVASFMQKKKKKKNIITVKYNYSGLFCLGMLNSLSTQVHNKYKVLSFIPPPHRFIHYNISTRNTAMVRLSAGNDDPAKITQQNSLLQEKDCSNKLEVGASVEVNSSKSNVDWSMTALAFLFPALGGALFGYDIGATSGALISLTDAVKSGTIWYDLSPLQQGLVVSMSLAGALTGSVLTLFMGDQLGRRRELLLAALLYGGAAAIAFFSASFDMLIIGRFIYGLAIGFAMHAAPAYIAETAPPQVRGLLISLKEGFIVGGILLGYFGSYLLIEVVGGWRYMFGAAGVAAFLLGIGMWWLPPSPRWLALSGSTSDQVKQSLVRVRGKYGKDDELIDTELQQVMQIGEKVGRKPTSDLDFSKLLQANNLRPLLIGLSLMMFQQITGQPSVLYYAAKIFQDAGFAGAQAATGVAVVLGVFKLLMTGVAVFTVESLGRRPLLLAGVSGMVVALFCLSLTQSAATQMAIYTSLVALLLYVGCYQVSFGPISWLMVGEIFPLEVRSQALSIATFTNFFSNFLVSLLLPTIQQVFGMASTYFLFGVVGIASVACIYSFVPETKGKTLEEIEAMWSQK